jgi:hypothetical protein
MRKLACQCISRQGGKGSKEFGAVQPFPDYADIDPQTIVKQG